MTPVSVMAQLQGQIAHPDKPIALDALVAYAVVLRDQIPFASTYEEMARVPIPIAEEPGGRFHLCSHSLQCVEEVDEQVRRINKRPPVAEAQAMGRRLGKGGFRSMQINAGPSKGYRMPIETGHLLDDQIGWLAMATDVAELESLLRLITHLGRRRGVGLGRVVSWTVETLSDTWDGFPVLDGDGRPLRPLPPDWPGLGNGAQVRMRRLTWPYHCGPDEPVAMPEGVTWA